MKNQIEAQEPFINQNAICQQESREEPTDLCQEEDIKAQLEKNSLDQSDILQQMKYFDENELSKQLNLEEYIQVHVDSKNPNNQLQSSQKNDNHSFFDSSDPYFGQDILTDPEFQNQVNLQTVVQTKVNTKIPGETKNLPKCFARRLKEFILSSVENSDDPELKNTLNDSDVKSFLKLKPEKISKQKLDIFIKTEIGSMFCQEFFGNCRWIYGITKEGKTSVDPYFRYNISYFQNSVKKIKPN